MKAFAPNQMARAPSQATDTRSQGLTNILAPIVLHSHLHSLQNGQAVRVSVECECVCGVHVCVCVRGCCERCRFPGSARSFPGVPAAEAKARKNFPGEQFPLTAAGPARSHQLPGGAWPAAGLQSGGWAPGRPACNRIVYIRPLSRNKTTESNIANRCLRPGPVLPARCSFEHPGRGEAWRPVPPDPADWGGDCCWNWGATEGLWGTERGGKNRRKGTLFFFLLLIFPMYIPTL